MLIVGRIVLTLSFAVFTTACSARVVFDPPFPVTASAEAVNINNASVDELESLPHIGRKTAEAIVQFREENGPFRRPEHLMLIRGISETRFLELRPLLKTE